MKLKKKRYLRKLIENTNNDNMHKDFHVITNQRQAHKTIGKYALYMKFVTNRYLKDFLNKGELHFGPISSFRNMGKTDKVIGDPNESVKIDKFNRGKVYITSSLGHKRHNFYLNLTGKHPATLKQPLNSNSNIFCLIRLTKKDMYELKPGYFKIKKPVINSLFKHFSFYGKTPILIKNIHVIYLLINTLLKNNHKTFCTLYNGPVHYSSDQNLALSNIYKNYKGRIFSDLKNKAVAFTKTPGYSYQHEYRFLLSNSSMLNKYNNLNIGNIIKYVMKITKSQLYDLVLILRFPNENKLIKMFSNTYKLRLTKMNYSHFVLKHFKPIIINKNIFTKARKK